MKLFPLILIGFGAIIIAFPEFLSFLIGGFFIFIGVNMLFLSAAFGKKRSQNGESYVKFWNYKIFR